MRRNDSDGYYGDTCLATVGSNTQAMRAKRALAASGISATVRKTERGGADGGCAFGVSYPCLYHASAVSVLRGAGITVTEYRNE